MKQSLYSLFLFVFPFLLLAQESEEGNAEEGLSGKSRITVGLGHTNLSEGEIEGKNSWLTVPSWTINYDYWINNELGIGIQSDLILEEFVIKDDKEEFIERKRPVSIVPVALFKPSERINLIGGIGYEFADGEDFAMTRIGFEYGVPLQEEWEVGVAVVWDGKWGFYNSYAIAFTISKIK